MRWEVEYSGEALEPPNTIVTRIAPETSRSSTSSRFLPDKDGTHSDVRVLGIGIVDWEVDFAHVVD